MFSTSLTHLFCYITNHLMTGPLGNSEFCFPRISMFPSTSSRETLRFSGNKIHCSPRDQSLSVKIPTLRNGKRYANGANVVVLIVSPLKSIMKEQIEEMEEFRIPSIVVSTKDDVLLLIGEAKYKLVFGRQRKTFWMQNSKTCYSPLDQILSRLL